MTNSKWAKTTGLDPSALYHVAPLNIQFPHHSKNYFLCITHDCRLALKTDKMRAYIQGKSNIYDEIFTNETLLSKLLPFYTLLSSWI